MRRIFLVLFACFTPLLAMAQQGSSGALNGIVHDASGAVVPNAAVVATETSTNVSSKTATSGVGVYTFPSLPPGSYTIAASQSGFRPASVTNVTLHVAQLLTIDLTLAVGTGPETVNVSGDAQLLETSTAQISHYVTTKEMETWPIPVTHDGERQLQEFIFDSLPGTSGNTFVGSINGGQYFSNEIYLDGVSMGTFDTRRRRAQRGRDQRVQHAGGRHGRAVQRGRYRGLELRRQIRHQSVARDALPSSSRTKL